MKTKSLLFNLLLFILLDGMLYGQTKLTYVSQVQDGQTVTLFAHNDSDENLLVTLRVRSKGMMLTENPILTREVKAHSKLEMISLSPMPGMEAHYNYKLSAIPMSSTAEITDTIFSQTGRTVILRNSSKLRGTAIFDNVKEKLPADKVALFVKNNCKGCKEAKRLLDEYEIPYIEFRTNKNEKTAQLMWDALLAYGVQDGRVVMPVLFSEGKVYHNIEKMDETIRNIGGKSN